jgi:putative inorganic carbon (HCO3(-)) transporter
VLRTLFVLFIFGIGVLAAFKSRFGALLLYVWFALFRPQEWVWFDISWMRLSLISGLLLVVPAVASGIYPDTRHVLSKLSWAFLLCAVVSHFFSYNPAVSWFWLDFLVTMLVVALTAVNMLTDRSKYVALVTVMALSFGFHAAKMGFGSVLGGGVELIQGTGGAFQDRNDFALGANMILPLMLAAAQTTRHTWLRWLLYAWTPLAVFGIVSTFSRGGFLGLVAVSGTYVMFHRRRWTMISALVLFVMFVVPFVPLPEGYVERLSTIRSPGEVEEGSALSRLHVWRVALSVAADNPMGVGLMSFNWAYPFYDFSEGLYGELRAVHNSWLQALAETGVLGFAAFVGAHLVAVFILFRIRRTARAHLPDELARFYLIHTNALVAVLAAFVVGGTFLSMALNDLTWFSFALIAGLDRLAQRDIAAARQGALVTEPVATPAEEIPQWAAARGGQA